MNKSEQWVLLLPVAVTVDTPKPVDLATAKEMAMMIYQQTEKLYHGEEAEPVATLFAECCDDDIEVIEGSSACRVCGCTENAACIDPEEPGGTCKWVDEGEENAAGPICSVCYRDERKDQQGDRESE